jgi:hypothetical protein
MTMAKALERFTIARAADGYLITVEDEAGDVMELNASFDQIDLIAEELDHALDNDADDALDTDDEEPVDEDE